MKLAITSLLLLSVVLFSCQQGKKDIILGQWHGSRFENPEMDKFFSDSQKYIDTLGKNGDAATNVELYGSANVDSIRRILQSQYDSTRSMQMNAVKNTTFTFNKDSIVVISFDGRMDTSKWYFLDDKKLQMEEMTGSEKGTKTQMDVVALSDKELTLKIEQGKDQEKTFSTVTFSRDKK